MDIAMTEIGKYQYFNAAPKCDFVKFRSDSFHRDNISMAKKVFQDCVRRQITLNRFKSEGDMAMLSLVRNLKFIKQDVYRTMPGQPA